MKNQKIYIKRDYYGNEGFGKRAYWFMDEQGNYTEFEGGNFMFVQDFEGIKKDYPDCEFIVVE